MSSQPRYGRPALPPDAGENPRVREIRRRAAVMAGVEYVIYLALCAATFATLLRR